jgi:hypothetical protein
MKFKRSLCVTFAAVSIFAGTSSAKASPPFNAANTAAINTSLNAAIASGNKNSTSNTTNLKFGLEYTGALIGGVIGLGGLLAGAMKLTEKRRSSRAKFWPQKPI